MSVELLNKDTVVKYLTDKKVISASDNAEVEVLTGGVSNVVLAITTANQKLVLKQALAELAVSEKWLADQRRAIVEADAIKLFNQLSPDQVPKLIFLDPERFILVLERVPVGSTVWKSDLLAGVINPDAGAGRCGSVARCGRVAGGRADLRHAGAGTASAGGQRGGAVGAIGAAGFREVAAGRADVARTDPRVSAGEGGGRAAWGGAGESGVLRGGDEGRGVF